MGNVNKEKLEEKLKTSGWSKLRTATRIASQFKNLNPPPTPGKTAHVHITYRMIYRPLIGQHLIQQPIYESRLFIDMTHKDESSNDRQPIKS